MNAVRGVDYRVRNGRVYLPGGFVDGDLLIRGEKIVGVVGSAEPVPATTEIDAEGRLVLPGLIDLHAHTRVPGYEYKEDFRTASESAAAGGITTFADMPNVEPPTETVELFLEKRRIAEQECLIDWGHLVSATKVDQIPALAAAGATGFKIFQVSGGYPHDPRLAMDDPARIYAAFEAVAATGLFCAVHPYSQSLFEYLSKQAVAAGQPRTIATFGRQYVADVVWRSAVAILLELQRETDVRMHLLHTHSHGSLRLIRRAKVEGQRVTAAVDLKYFHMRAQDLEEQGARALPGGNVTENAERLNALWQGMSDGAIDVIDSDHAPHTFDDLKRMEADPWTGPWGSPQYDYLLSVLLTDVRKGKFTLPRLVQMVSENPAKLAGFYPRKGALLPGSDADVVIVDAEREVVPTDERTYTKVRWTPYRGMRLQGAPVLTMLRGRIIARDGKVIGEPGYGRYMPGVPQG